MRLLDRDDVIAMFEIFKSANPEPKSELIAPNPFCLLVSVVLSAQATDKSVNKATEPLYKIADTPQKLLNLGEEQLIFYIKSIGLYKNKAKHIMGLSRMLVDKFNSTVPDNMQDLLSLPGVGRKTANVILNVVYHQPTMPVDTHLQRICPKMGLAKGTNPLEIEKSLIERIPPEYMEHAHHWLILHGRYICTARTPKCDQCPVCSLCAHND